MSNDCRTQQSQWCSPESPALLDTLSTESLLPSVRLLEVGGGVRLRRLRSLNGTGRPPGKVPPQARASSTSSHCLVMVFLSKSPKSKMLIYMWHAMRMEKKCSCPEEKSKLDYVKACMLMKWQMNGQKDIQLIYKYIFFWVTLNTDQVSISLQWGWRNHPVHLLGGGVTARVMSTWSWWGWEQCGHHCCG